MLLSHWLLPRVLLSECFHLVQRVVVRLFPRLLMFSHLETCYTNIYIYIHRTLIRICHPTL